MVGVSVGMGVVASTSKVLRPAVLLRSMGSQTLPVNKFIVAGSSKNRNPVTGFQAGNGKSNQGGWDLAGAGGINQFKVIGICSEIVE